MEPRCGTAVNVMYIFLGDILEAEAKYWRDKWLESQRVVAALRDLFTEEGKPKKFKKVKCRKRTKLI